MSPRAPLRIVALLTCLSFSAFAADTRQEAPEQKTLLLEAEKGDAKAMTELAQSYLEATYGPRDGAAAMTWYRGESLPWSVQLRLGLGIVASAFR